MRAAKQSQGRRLIALLKRRRYSSMELLQTGISGCWWKRVGESLKPYERLDSKEAADGLLRYRVVTATKWTA
jgi:hypothetical protein